MHPGGGKDYHPVLKEIFCMRIYAPEARDGKKIKIKEGLPFPSLYVGESSRSIQERGVEHWKAWKENSQGSHIMKHHVQHHGGEGAPAFHLRAVRYYRTALSRQVGEAVRIRRRGDAALLNSKAEFN